MLRNRRHWSPDSTDVISVANIRMCLVLLRIYRSVPRSVAEVEEENLLRPFWPLIRTEPAHLRRAIAKTPWKSKVNRRRPGRALGELNDEGAVPEWLADLLDTAAPLPEAPPDRDVFLILAEGLLLDQPCFRGLFDAIERRLERLITKHRISADRNLELLAELLDFSAAERSLLTLCHAIEAGSIGSSPFAQFKTPSHKLKSLQVGLNLISEQEVRTILSPRSRLMRSGLMDRDHAEKMHHRDLEDLLRLSRQGSRLLGIPADSIQDMAAIVLKPLPASKSEISLAWPHLDSRSELLQPLLANALNTGARGINVLLYGAPGTGKSEYAADLVTKVGALGFSIEDTDEYETSATRGERLDSLHLSQQFAPAQRSILVLDEAEDVFQADYNNPLARVFGKREGSKAWMNGLLEGNAKPVIWISNQVGHIDPAYLRRFTYCLEFPTTPRGVRRTIAKTHLEKVHCSPELIDSVASHCQVTPSLLSSAARFASLADPEKKVPDQAVRHMLTDSLKAMGTEISAEVPRRVTRFDLRYLNVKGRIQPEAVVSGLKRIGRGTLLLSGVPGTGKTQLAAEIAQRLDRELVYKTASDINTMWFGESERNVARMFTECDPTSEILFLDEADTLLASRGVESHRANTAVAAEFLRRVEAFEGVFVCATNYGARIDAALMRRFSFRLEFLPLSAVQRYQFLCETALGWESDSGLPQPELEPLTASRLGRLDQLTPGDFANVVKRMRALGLSLDEGQWVDELSIEHQAKPNSTSSHIGFY